LLDVIGKALRAGGLEVGSRQAIKSGVAMPGSYGYYGRRDAMARLIAPSGTVFGRRNDRRIAWLDDSSFEPTFLSFA
jgi:hypothetical protein